MGEVASLYADYIIITNDNPRCEEPITIANDIAKGIKNKKFEIILNRREAIKKAVEMADDFDSVLILGKGDERYIEFCNKKIEFNDKEEIKKCLK